MTAQGAGLLSIILTDEFWQMPTSGNQLALHSSVGPHNAIVCLLMAGLLIYMVVSGASYTSKREHASLSVAACATAIISLLAILVACCQLIGWVATFGELLRLDFILSCVLDDSIIWCLCCVLTIATLCRLMAGGFLSDEHLHAPMDALCVALIASRFVVFCRVVRAICGR